MSDFWVGPASKPDTYRLVNLLGGGGEGEVWKAILPLSAEGKRSVAVKITRDRYDDGRWEEHGHLLRSVSHPGLVRVTDVFLGPPMHRKDEAGAKIGGLRRYVVMDFIDGSNLREWIAENPDATASERLRLLSMVAAALDEMHSGAATEVAVAHGDVKPANIVVRPDDSSILVDLGLARLADSSGLAGRSAAYAAPELRTKGALATPEADRYAFAVTTAHLLAGQAPPLGADGWLDPQALREMLSSTPLTARRHTLVSRIMSLVNSPPEARPRELRKWLDSAVESLSQATSTGLPVVAIAQPPAGIPPHPAPDAAPPDDSSPVSPAKAALEETTDNPKVKSPDNPDEEKFGPYRLQSLLGRGGMGEVFRALDTSRNRVVALKRLPAAMADDPEFQARFREESALAARLNEPHIIPIHDFGDIDGRLFIDMRLVEGTDLSNLLAEHGPLAPGRAVHVIRQIAAALDSAHGAGLVHRDVKPANVLLRTADTDTGTDLDDGHDFAYLVDFGIARAIDNPNPGLTGKGSAIGSVIYMAPERFRGESDHRVDIYALGCLLYECLTGQKPYPADNTAAVMHAHLYFDPPRPSQANPTTPAAFDAVVAMAMAKDPGDRYPTAGALATAARNALALAEGVTVPDASNANTSHIPPSAGHAIRTAQPARPAQPSRPAQPPADSLKGSTTGNRTNSGRSRLLLATCVLILAAAIGSLFGFSAQGAPEGPGLGVVREPIQTPGINPYMPTVGDDIPNVQAPPESRGEYSGELAGLYGGTLNISSCDRDKMVGFLGDNPDKGMAWAGVQGITPEALPSYVSGLTPLVLRSDTSVTNHGFVNGRATPVNSILQAGTAVLVDDLGTPRARCYCGNPLTPAEPEVSLKNQVGPAWTGYNTDSVVSIRPANTQIVEFTIIDPLTGQVIFRPQGTAGELDRLATPPPATAAPPLPPPPGPAPAPPTAAPQVAPPPACPQGQSMVGGRCQYPPCPAGEIRDGDDCERPKCPKGKERVNDECVPKCPKGYERFNNDDCRPKPCSDGQQRRDTNECPNPLPPPCPGGLERVNGDCPKPPCPEGQIRDGDECRCSDNEPEPC
ncbi:MAG: protein kinase domain-containing protein [Pseudonocardia sp.]